MKGRERTHRCSLAFAACLAWFVAPLQVVAEHDCYVEPDDPKRGRCYGNGYYGDVVISEDTVLTENMDYWNLTVMSGVTLDTAGYRVRVCETLLNQGTITDTVSGGSSGAFFGGSGQDPCEDSGGPPWPEDGSCVCMSVGPLYPESGGGGACGCSGGGGGGAARPGDPCLDADGGNGGNGGNGGHGGGYVRIFAFNLDNEGVIHADGQDGAPGDPGTDGEYWMARERCKDFAGGGGGGGAGGAGGDGGTVELHYDNLVNLNEAGIHANAGHGGPGGPGGHSGTTVVGHALECTDWVDETSYPGANGGCYPPPTAWCGGDGGDGAHQQGASAEDGEPGEDGPDGSSGQVNVAGPKACCLSGGIICKDRAPFCCDLWDGYEGYNDYCMGDLGNDGIDDACQPWEACCLPDDTCADVPPNTCQYQYGIPQGPGTECKDLWACCLDGGVVCVDIDAICCDDIGGYLGNAASCAGDLNGNGIDDACEGVPIPTVSEWGMVAMAVLVLIAGTLIFVRRGALSKG